MLKFPLFVLLLVSFSGCNDGGFNVFSIDEDVNLGKQFSLEIEAQPAAFPLLNKADYPEAYQHLNKITKSILASNHILHRDDFQWEVNIIDNDTILNAFCTPGGYIYVYTGLIKYLDSEDQLAGVLGHEIAHADLRHSTKQMTKGYGIGLVSKLIFGNNSIVGNVASSLAGLTFSRDDETEADLQSVLYLYDTDYDPRGVARFFQKMEAKGETLGPLVFLSTHPNPENRVEQIYDQWTKLGSKKGKTFKIEYADFKASLPSE